MANLPKELIKSVPSSEPEPSVQIKKFKQCQGTDGVAYSCDLYVNGKLSCHVTNDGGGGVGCFYWVDKENQKIWDSWRKGLDAYLWSYNGESKSMPHDDDMALEFFLTAHDIARWIKRNRKNKCMVQLRDLEALTNTLSFAEYFLNL